jgi:RNA-binding protein Musashi
MGGPNGQMGGPMGGPMGPMGPPGNMMQGYQGWGTPPQTTGYPGLYITFLFLTNE